MKIFDSLIRLAKYIRHIEREYVNNFNGQRWISAEIEYRWGMKNGVTKYYWKRHVSAEGSFTNGKETGEIKQYFRVEDELKDIKNHPLLKEFADIEKGVYETYSLDGKLLERCQIKGVKFTKGSSSSNEGYYGAIHPIRNGLCEKWFKNGNLKEKGHWGDNNSSIIYNLSFRKGEHIQFHKNGKELRKGVWKNKIPVGLHQFFYSNGNIEFELYFENGKIIKEYWYNEDGSFMNPDQIIEKGGINPRQMPFRNGITHISYNHGSLNKKEDVVINDLKFSRCGTVAFDSSYYYLGHSYELI